MLEIRGLHKIYGKYHALSGLDMTVARQNPSKRTKKHLRKPQMFTKNALTFLYPFGKIKRL